MKPVAVMNIEKGEEIAAFYISGHIPGTGRYKFIAKKKVNGKYEWAHFKERDNGSKEGVYKGEVESAAQLYIALSIMNKNLTKIFGPNAEMKEGKPEFRTITGQKSDDTVN
jgi:hypothetical protein